MADEPQIEDGEIVEEETLTSDQTVTGGEVLINMEGMIKNHITSIDKLQIETKNLSDMLNDIFNNDPTFKEHTEAAKEANKIKAATKQQILKQPQARDLNDKIKTLKSESKELQNSLSDYLQEYQRMSGVNEIETEDGQVREIVYIAKLIRRTGR